MSIPTPEQTRELVEHFGSQRAAAAEVAVGASTIGRWLHPERAAEYSRRHRKRHLERRRLADREYARKRREDPEYRERTRAYLAEYRAAGKHLVANKTAEQAEATRAAQRKYARRRYYRRKDEGLCVLCGEPGLSETMCLDCLTKHTVYG